MKAILTPSVRFPLLDLLRGWCLVVIAADHLTRFPSIFDPVTGRGLLWVTAAEGFFFISGILIGIVRMRTYEQSGFAAMLRKTWSRAGKLYLASIVLTLIFTAIGYWVMQHGGVDLKTGLIYYSSILQLIWQTLILNYTYGWTDFLNYYVAYLLLAPFALWLIRKRLWWVVLALVLFFWSFKSVLIFPFHPEFAIWQIYFFGGVLVGAYKDQLIGTWRSFSSGARQALRVSTITIAAVTIVASFAITFGTPFFQHHAAPLAPALAALHLPSTQELYSYVVAIKDNQTFTFLFQRDRTGLMRPLLFLVWFGALVFLVRRFWTPIEHAVGWLLIPLGMNSLYVYITEGILIFFVPFLHLPNTFVVNSLTVMTVIGLVWLAVRQRFLFSIIPR